MPSLSTRPLISFDWAIKRLLRQKANYDILEGFLTELLKQEVIISNIPESESNQDNANDKANKVDILCENQKGELLLIELQYYSEWDFMHRMLYGTSRLITDYHRKGEPYSSIKKVYSINIVYFELGHGNDYVYHGKTEFHGIHQNDILQLSQTQQNKLKKNSIHHIYPEYYIIKVNNFDDVAKDRLDEWIYYLKNNKLPENFKAAGLKKVAEQLNVENMNTQERINYDAHLKSLAISHNMLETAKLEGMLEGEKKGKLEGEEKTKKVTALKLIARGFPNEDIVEITGMDINEIRTLRKAI